MKNKKLLTVLIVIAAILLVVIWIVGINNKMVKADENAQQSWAQVENVYQRRANLIDNLVRTVQGAADFEKGTLESVISARASASSMQIDAANMTEADLAKFQQVQDNLTSSLNRLMVVVERYPDLKANQNFLALQEQLEGSENRITVEIKKFNEAVMSYNNTIRRFPNSMFARLFGFEKKVYFKAKEGSDVAPKVEFEF